MKLWITEIKQADGSIKKRGWNSRDEARDGIGADANGTAQFVDINSDKAGIIAIFNGDYVINDVEKKFEIKNGKWHTRVG